MKNTEIPPKWLKRASDHFDKLFGRIEPNRRYENSMSEGDFEIRPPQTEPDRARPSARAVINQMTTTNTPEIPSVWTQIQEERRKIIAAPSERAKEQKKADAALRVKTAVTPKPSKAPTEETTASKPPEDDVDYGSLLEVRSKIETLLDEQQARASENEMNLVELRLVLENMNYQFLESPIEEETGEVAKYMGQVQVGQEKLQDSIAELVKGAAQLFLQKNKLKVDKLQADINDLTFQTTQVDEQIRVKNALLEERLNRSAKIDATNAGLRRRIESTKNEIRAIAGQDFEDIPELARTYQETMKKIIAEEVELTKQLWDVQQQLEHEKKDQVQMSLLYQKVKDHPLRMAQLQEEMEGKLAVLRNELFEKEKIASQQRGQMAMTYQNETQRLVIQARKEREEQLFKLKTAQIQQLIQAEKQSREEKMSMITSANATLASNKQFKQKLAAFDRESKGLVDSYEQTVKRLSQEFVQSERRMKREHDAKIAAVEEQTKLERQDLENEVSAMEVTLAAKDEQYQHSTRKLESLQTQLAQLKEKIAKYDVANKQLEKALGGNSMESEELMHLLTENRNRKLEEVNTVKRKLLDIISSLSYFMVLSGESDGDWLQEAQECYQDAIKECESESAEVKHVPVPFFRHRIPPQELFKNAKPPERRSSIG